MVRVTCVITAQRLLMGVKVTGIVTVSVIPVTAVTVASILLKGVMMAGPQAEMAAQAPVVLRRGGHVPAAREPSVHAQLSAAMG